MKGADNECFAAGMDGYLSKPIDRDELDSTLARFLSESAGAKESNGELDIKRCLSPEEAQ